jgi:aspartate kinase
MEKMKNEKEKVAFTPSSSQCERPNWLYEAQCSLGRARQFELLIGYLADANINVDMIVQNVGHDGVATLTFTVPQTEMTKAEKALAPVVKETGGSVTLDDKIAKLSVVGVGMRTHSGVASTLFTALAGADVNLELISTSEIKISVVIAKTQADEAARVVHKAFGLENL